MSRRDWVLAIVVALCVPSSAFAGGQPIDPLPEDSTRELDAQEPRPPADAEATEDPTASRADEDSHRPGLLAGLPDDLHLGATLSQETAYRLDSPHVFTKIRQQAVLVESGPITDSLNFYARQRAWYDAIYDVAENFPESAERAGMEWEYELRETYLDYSAGDLDVRLGKQQIVWGEALGLFFADVVNAKDLREYILPDFEWIRIPQWGVDAEWTHDDSHAELVWLPVRQFNRLAPSGAEFEFPYPVPGGTPFTTIDPSTPPSSFNNSEAGVRLSQVAGGWDVGAFYFYTWDKSPIPFRAIDGNTFHFHPEYERAHLIGTTFSKEIRDVVLRGEMVYNPRQSLATFDTRDPDGILEKSVVDYVVGAGYTWFDQLQTNVQWMQRWIPNHRNFMEEDSVRTHVSLWAKMDLLDGKLQPECLVLTGITEVDLLYRPKVTYKATDNLELTVGFDVFQGRQAGLFGRFDEKSRAYTEVTYHF